MVPWPRKKIVGKTPSAQTGFDNRDGQTSRLPTLRTPTKPPRQRQEYLKKWREKNKRDGQKPLKPFAKFTAYWTETNAAQLPHRPADIMKQASKAWWSLPHTEREKWKQDFADELMQWEYEQAEQFERERADKPTQDGQTSASRPCVAADTPDGQTSAAKVEVSLSGGEALLSGGGGAPRDSKAMAITIGPYWVETTQEQLIGKGGYGSVYRGLHRASRQFVAVKVFHDQSEDETINREIEIYERTRGHVDHVPLARLLWSNREHSGMKAVVLELFDNDLHHYLSSHRVSQDTLTSMGIQIARALSYLHIQTQIVHLDVKPPNILWRTLDNKIAVVDFGLSEPIGSPRPLRDTYCTLNFRPPELWGLPGPPTPQLLQPAVDAWSFGCTWWQMIVGDAFFPGTREKDVRNQIGQFCADYSTARFGPWKVRAAKAGRWAGFVLACLNPKPTARLKDRLHNRMEAVDGQTSA